jgi:serine/threonine protein kinase
MNELASDQDFGSYRLLSRLGVGGMGEVYLASAAGLDGVERKVAIKVVRPMEQSGAALDELFVEEAKISFLLNHPNVVSSYEIGEVDGRYFLVLEYVDGAGLSRLMGRARDQDESIGMELSVYVGSQIARGLHYAHSLCDDKGLPLRLVHRDISPGNVLISRRGQVKVSDFGLAKSAMRSVQSELGVIKGKVAYMAPEQLRGELVDSRADIYALGVVLYEMLAREHPFGEPSELDLAARLGKKKVQPLFERMDISRALSDAVATCMQPKVSDRYETARDLAKALDLVARDFENPASEFELAERVESLLDDAQQKVVAPHPFDLALGIELQRAGGGAISTFIAKEASQTKPGSKGSPDTLARIEPYQARPRATEAPQSLANGPQVVSAARRRAKLKVAALVIAVLAGGFFLGVRVFFLRESSPPLAFDARKDAAASHDQKPVSPAGDSTVAKPADAGIRLPDASTAATLVLESKPTGAAVFIDGKPAGTTPLSLSGLAAGNVRLRISKPGFHPFDRRIVLRSGVVLKLQPQLARRVTLRTRKQLGMLSVGSDPWAIVFIDGARIRSTPLVGHRLTVGRHRVVLVNQRRSLRSAKRVVIRANKVLKCSVLLATRPPKWDCRR